MSRLTRHSLHSNDGLSSSTLRARLSSPEPSSTEAGKGASSSPQDADLQLSDLYKHFRACFAPTVPGNSSAIMADNTLFLSMNGDGKQCSEVMALLGDSFAKAGLKLHSSVAAQLSEAQKDINSQINDFANTSSTILSNITHVYGSLSYPLSATLCHSAKFPRATIAAHLASVKKQLNDTEEEIRRLQDQWEEASRAEDELRKELGRVDQQLAPNSRQKSKQEAEFLARLASFKEGAERIVTDKIQALDDIDAQYKEWIQAETMEIMQSILAD